jgi:hypothetical protein
MVSQQSQCFVPAGLERGNPSAAHVNAFLMDALTVGSRPDAVDPPGKLFVCPLLVPPLRYQARLGNCPLTERVTGERAVVDRSLLLHNDSSFNCTRRVGSHLHGGPIESRSKKAIE